MNDATNGLFGLYLLIGLAVVSIVGSSAFFKSEISFAAGFWFTTIMGVLMLFMGWISGIYVYIGIILCAIFAVIFSISAKS